MFRKLKKYSYKFKKCLESFTKCLESFTKCFESSKNVKKFKKCKETDYHVKMQVTDGGERPVEADPSLGRVKVSVFHHLIEQNKNIYKFV